MKIVIVSMFVAYIVHGHFGIRDAIKRWLKYGSRNALKNELLDIPVKPIDCLPCLSFYVAIITAATFMLIEWSFTTNYIYAILVTYVINETIDKFKRP